ncbi:glycosyltransferase [Cupriavidus basilensis]
MDIFIPTYNEPLSVVKPTVFAAMSLDWPRDKINVYVLDDGRRDEFREFLREGRRRPHHAQPQPPRRE